MRHNLTSRSWGLFSFSDLGAHYVVNLLLRKLKKSQKTKNHKNVKINVILHFNVMMAILDSQNALEIVT